VTALAVEERQIQPNQSPRLGYVVIGLQVYLLIFLAAPQLLDKQHSELNLALILITHDFGLVGELCNRMLVIYAGCVVEAGTPMRFSSRPCIPALNS
jgi:ABC-type phosphonate transport system ATPase subunit